MKFRIIPRVNRNDSISFDEHCVFDYTSKLELEEECYLLRMGFLTDNDIIEFSIGVNSGLIQHISAVNCKNVNMFDPDLFNIEKSIRSDVLFDNQFRDEKNYRVHYMSYPYKFYYGDNKWAAKISNYNGMLLECRCSDHLNIYLSLDLNTFVGFVLNE